VTVDQFSRPARNLLVEAPLVAPIPDDWREQGTLVFESHGSLLTYRPVAADEQSASVPGQTPWDFKKAPDWVEIG